MATIFDPKKPKTLMIAGSILCILAFAEIVSESVWGSGLSFTGLWGIVVSLCIIYLGYRKRRQEQIGGGQSVRELPKGALAKRKLIIYVCVNLGIALAEWRSIEIGLSLGLVIVSGLICLVLFNGLIFLMLRSMGSSKDIIPQKSGTQI